MNLMKLLDYILFFLSLAIAVILLIKHTAEWELITAYWIVNAVKNGIKAGEK